MTFPVVPGAMSSADRQTSGLYRHGDSFLHRLDPRVKLSFLLLLIVCLFAAPSPERLLGLLVVAAGGVAVGRLPFRQLLKRLLLLRWLLLFSLLLHLFFTPGRTLLGTSWLSYDGLLRGLTVDLQLSLSLVFSYLLALTTAPAALARGLTRLLSPLGRLGVPVRESGGLLILVLHFVPLVRDEALLLYRKNHCPRFLDRVRAATGLIGPLLLRLVDRADALAHEMSADGLPEEQEPVGRDGKIAPIDRGMLIAGLPVLMLLWMI